MRKGAGVLHLSFYPYVQFEDYDFLKDLNLLTKSCFDTGLEDFNKSFQTCFSSVTPVNGLRICLLFLSIVL